MQSLVQWLVRAINPKGCQEAAAGTEAGEAMAQGTAGASPGVAGPRPPARSGLEAQSTRHRSRRGFLQSKKQRSRFCCDFCRDSSSVGSSFGLSQVVSAETSELFPSERTPSQTHRIPRSLLVSSPCVRPLCQVSARAHPAVRYRRRRMEPHSEEQRL